MREMRILLATSDFFFSCSLFFFTTHPPHLGSRSLAVRRPTRVRGVGLGFASREPQAIPTELDSESSCHNDIPLGITRQVPRNYLSVSWRAARDAPTPATPAHARTRRTAHARTLDAARRRFSPAASPERMCTSPYEAMGRKKGSDRPWSKEGKRPPTAPTGPRVERREATAHGRKKGSDRPPVERREATAHYDLGPATSTR